jgi:small subunit ribosomal protein S1
MQADDVWEGKILEANRGGLIVPFGNLRGFVPASHITNLPRGISEQERQQQMNEMVGKTVKLKIIEVNHKRRRLVFSQREAVREQRAIIKEQLMDELKEGDVCEGVVSGLRDFGAFVDLGGADGLIHISELAWHRVQHPSEVVSVGDKIQVYIMHLDQQDHRIGLSLKRLQENPWSKVDDLYHIGQLVMGEVSRVAPYGAFVRLEPGIEALLHSTQVDNPAPDTVEGLIEAGQQLLLRVISIEADRQRLGLSLKDVTDAERANWAATYDLEVASLTLEGEAPNYRNDQDDQLDEMETSDEPSENEPVTTG